MDSEKIEAVRNWLILCCKKQVHFLGFCSYYKCVKEISIIAKLLFSLIKNEGKFI